MSWLGAEEWEAVALSLKVAFWATILSLPVAIAVAYALARGRFWGHGLLNGLVHLPLVLPPVVTGYLLLVFFGSQGLGGRVLDAVGMPIAFRWTGAVLAAAVMAFPLVVRAIRLSIEAVDVRLEDAAATLGASPLRVFLTVTLPMAMPGVSGGGGARLCQGDGRIWCDDHVCVQCPGRDADTLAGCLQLPASSRRRKRGCEACDHCCCRGHGRAVAF